MDKNKFNDIKVDILKAVDQIENHGVNEKVTLIEGFVNHPIGDVVRGGPTIPTIAFVGDSGRIYFFVLKKLLPDIKL